MATECRHFRKIFVSGSAFRSALTIEIAISFCLLSVLLLLLLSSSSSWEYVGTARLIYMCIRLVFFLLSFQIYRFPMHHTHIHLSFWFSRLLRRFSFAFFFFCFVLFDSLLFNFLLLFYYCYCIMFACIASRLTIPMHSLSVESSATSTTKSNVHTFKWIQLLCHNSAFNLGLYLICGDFFTAEQIIQIDVYVD